MMPTAGKLYGDAEFIFQQCLASAHTAKSTNAWFNDYGIPLLDWLANSIDLNLIEHLRVIVKGKMRQQT